MGKTKIFFLFLYCVLCYAPAIFAQNPVTGISATTSYISPDQAARDTMPRSILLMEQRAVTLSVTIASSSGVSKIAASIGSSEGSNDLFYKEFEFGTEDDFADGTSYHATGNTIALGVGNYAGAAAYYAEVYAIMNDGTRGESRRYTIE